MDKVCCLSHATFTIICALKLSAVEMVNIFSLSRVSRNMKGFQMWYALHFYKYQSLFTLRELEKVSVGSAVLKNSPCSVFFYVFYVCLLTIQLFSLLSVTAIRQDKSTELSSAGFTDSTPALNITGVQEIRKHITVL